MLATRSDVLINLNANKHHVIYTTISRKMQQFGENILNFLSEYSAEGLDA
jgi:hypothetical protein